MEQRGKQQPKLHPFETQRERERAHGFFANVHVAVFFGQYHHLRCNCKLDEGEVRWVGVPSSVAVSRLALPPASRVGVSPLPKHNVAKCFSSAEGTVSVPAVQPHGQHWLHPWGGHTGGPVRILEALGGAVIGHRQLALLGGQVLSAATERPDQDGHRQEKEGASDGHNVIPVDGQGRHRNASPW